MSGLYSFKLDELEKYLNKIFELQANLKARDSKIALLEFELAIEKLLLEELKSARFQASGVN